MSKIKHKEIKKNKYPTWTERLTKLLEDVIIKTQAKDIPKYRLGIQKRLRKIWFYIFSNKDCDYCHGDGGWWEGEWEHPCPECNGRGTK